MVLAGAVMILAGACSNTNFSTLKMPKNVKLDAQRQYMVIGTLALLLILLYVIFCVSRAAAPEETGGG